MRLLFPLAGLGLANGLAAWLLLMPDPRPEPVRRLKVTIRVRPADDDPNRSGTAGKPESARKRRFQVSAFQPQGSEAERNAPDAPGASRPADVPRCILLYRNRLSALTTPRISGQDRVSCASLALRTVRTHEPARPGCPCDGPGPHRTGSPDGLPVLLSPMSKNPGLPARFLSVCLEPRKPQSRRPRCQT